MWYNSHIVAIIHLYGRGDPRLPALPPMANYTTCASRSWYNSHIVAIIHLYGRGDPRLPALPPMANYITCASRS